MDIAKIDENVFDDLAVAITFFVYRAKPWLDSNRELYYVAQEFKKKYTRRNSNDIQEDENGEQIIFKIEEQDWNTFRREVNLLTDASDFSHLKSLFTNFSANDKLTSINNFINYYRNIDNLYHSRNRMTKLIKPLSFIQSNKEIVYPKNIN